MEFYGIFFFFSKNDNIKLFRVDFTKKFKIFSFSYIDPVGSLIEVNYSMNTDKTDYVEDRRVYKNYVNSGVPDTSGGLSAEEIVEKVLKDLTPTVIQVVRVTVQGKNFLCVEPMQCLKGGIPSRK